MMNDEQKKLTGWRRLATYAGSWTVAIAYIALWLRADVEFHVLPALYVLLFVAAPLINELPSIAARLSARAFWWQSTLLYALLGGYAFYRLTDELGEHDIASTLANVPLHWEMLAVLGIGVGSAVALAAAGARGLDMASGHFAPVRFRKTMLAALLFGAADFMALTMYATLTIWDGRASHMDEAGLLVAAAAAMAIALMGLFRLRLWGLVACIAANVAVAGLALSGALGLPDVLELGLVATAVAQLFIPIPMVREIVAGLRRGALAHG